MEQISQIKTLSPEDSVHSKAIHGGTNIAESRVLNYQKVNDFSASISPINISKEILQLANNLDLSQYPDPDCLLLKERISTSLSTFSLNKENISIGNGSTEIIYAIASAFLQSSRLPSSKSLIFHPTYGEYFTVSTLFKSQISLLTPTYLNPGWDWDWNLAADFIQEMKPNLIFLCNPNNPTGTYFEKSKITNLLKSMANQSSILVIDEAYIDFVTDHNELYDLVNEHNVILLRSLTKSYGVTGLRLGYCLANPKIISVIDKYLPPWSVNSLAQIAGLNLFSDNDHIARGKAIVDESKVYLMNELGKLGYTVEPSETNFILIKVSDATEMRIKLLEKNIMVRDCSSFDLPQHIRIAIKTVKDSETFIHAIHGLA